MVGRKSIIMGMLLILGLVLPVSAQDAGGTTDQTSDQGSTFIVVSYDLFQRANLEHQDGDYEQAIQDYTLFILLNPTWGQGYYWRGRAYADLEEFDSALADYNQALAYPSGAADLTGQIYSDRATIYMQQDNLEAAASDLDAAIENAPELPDPYFYRAQLHMGNAEWEEALSDYSKLVELVPQFPGGYAGRAAANAELGNVDEAMADFDHWIELAPNDASAFYQRSLVKASQGDFEGALADTNSAIDLQPLQPALYLQRASLDTELGDTTAAAADYLQWIRAMETRGIDLNQLRPGESQVIPMAAGVSYSLPFRAITGQNLTLSANARETGDVDPLLVLLDTNGNAVAADDDGGGDTNALIEDYAVPTDGVYTLVVSHSGGGTDGAIRVLLEVE